jgi:hypothetical protein
MGRARRLVVVLAVALSMGACGSDDSESADAASDCAPVEIRDGNPATRVTPEHEELTAAVAESFCSEFTVTSPDGQTTTWTRSPVVTGEDAVCIADELIGHFGESVRELGLVGYPWDLLGFALGNSRRGLEREQAEQVVDSFTSCSDSWKLLLIKSVTEGADEISDESARCVSEQLSDDDAREVMVLEIDRAYDDPSQTDAVPYPETVMPLITAMEACLSPTELDRLDWN